jgi:hypothetical protein
VYLDAALQVAGYTVDGIVDPWTANYVDFSVAPGTGVQVLLLRVVQLTQLSVYGVAGAFPAKTTEKNLDLQMMANQQFDEILDRAITLPVESTLTATDIPDPADPLNYGLGLKIATDGSGLDTFSLSDTPFTSPLTTKGDLAVFSTVADRLAVGADGAFLIGASGQTRGAKYFVPGTNGYVLQSDSAQTDKLAWVAPNQPINPIINGNMEIWQRGTTFASIGGSYSADRWAIWDHGGAREAVININRSTNVPTVGGAVILFNYSLEVDVTTAESAVADSEGLSIIQHIEGYNWRHFAQRGLVISFLVMSSTTGTHCVALQNSGKNRSYVATYTINSANTWEEKSITVAASPSAGTWDYTTGRGVTIFFPMMLGASRQTTAGSWQTGDFVGVAGMVNALDSTANFFRITGVKMELGSVATPIQFVPFEFELARAQRYYQKSFPYATAPIQNAGTGSGGAFSRSPFTATSAMACLVQLHPEMRVSPSVTTYNPSAANAQVRNITDAADDSSTAVSPSSVKMLAIAFTPNAANTAGDEHMVHWTADSEL